LKKSVRLPVYVDEVPLIQNDIGKAVAGYLYEIFESHSILGVSWVILQ
jgi:deoxyribonucleoside regulator